MGVGICWVMEVLLKRFREGVVVTGARSALRMGRRGRGRCQQARVWAGTRPLRCFAVVADSPGDAVAVAARGL